VITELAQMLEAMSLRRAVQDELDRAAFEDRPPSAANIACRLVAIWGFVLGAAVLPLIALMLAVFTLRGAP